MAERNSERFGFLAESLQKETKSIRLTNLISGGAGIVLTATLAITLNHLELRPIDAFLYFLAGSFMETGFIYVARDCTLAKIHQRAQTSYTDLLHTAQGQLLRQRETLMSDDDKPGESPMGAAVPPPKPPMPPTTPALVPARIPPSDSDSGGTGAKVEIPVAVEKEILV